MSCFMFTTGDHDEGDSIDTLLLWLEHFRKTKMPAGLVFADGKLSLWRAGERRGYASKTDKPVGLLYAHINNFGVIWAKAGGKIANPEPKIVDYNAKKN